MVSRNVAAGVCALGLAAGGAWAQFDTAITSATVDAVAKLGGIDDADTNAGTLYPFFVESSEASAADLDNDAFAAASGSMDFQFPAANRIVARGSASADVDDPNQDYTGTGSFADGVSVFEIEFTVGDDSTWVFDSGFFGGSHASASISLRLAFDNSVVFEFTNQDTSGESGDLPAGTYVLAGGASAHTELDDGFGGLSAGASYFFEFRIDPVPSPSSGLVLGLGALVGVRRRR